MNTEIEYIIGGAIMTKHKLFLLTSTFLLSASLFLGGCQDTVGSNMDSNPQPEEKPTITEPEPPKEEVIPTIVDISIEPQSLTLSPGSKYKVSLISTLSNQVREEIAAEDHVELKFTSSYPEAITVSEDGIIHVSDEANIGSSAVIQAQYKDSLTELIITVSYSLEDTITVIEDGIDKVTNVDSIAVVVNKQRSLPDPSNYVPEDLIKPDVPFSFTGENERRYLRSEAAKALEDLFQQAKEEDIEIVAVSGYRSYGTQKAIYNNNLKTKGEEHTRRYSAFPGTSEHQTGLAMDVSSPSINNRLEDTLGDTQEGIWLAANAPDFGFIIRYPEGKEDITGYAYEPWHLRYVGKDLAQTISEQATTLEEFFSESVPVSQETN
jgi:LAS superfamily LD-carboxypeptidase LdcB